MCSEYGRMWQWIHVRRRHATDPCRALNPTAARHGCSARFVSTVCRRTGRCKNWWRPQVSPGICAHGLEATMVVGCFNCPTQNTGRCMKPKWRNDIVVRLSEPRKSVVMDMAKPPPNTKPCIAHITDFVGALIRN